MTRSHSDGLRASNASTNSDHERADEEELANPADGETGDEKEEHAGPDKPDKPELPAPVIFVGKLQEVVYFAVGVILLVVGAAVLVRTATDFVTHDGPWTERVTTVVNGVLFVVIVLELLRTVLAHFEDATFHLKPFLIIGIVSVVRHILTVGAEVSLDEEAGNKLIHRSDVELAVNALVVVALVVGLVLVRKTE